VWLISNAIQTPPAYIWYIFMCALSASVVIAVGAIITITSMYLFAAIVRWAFTAISSMAGGEEKDTKLP